MSWIAFHAPNDVGSSSFAATKPRTMLTARTTYCVNASPSESRVNLVRRGLMSGGPFPRSRLARREVAGVQWPRESHLVRIRREARVPGRRAGARHVPADLGPGPGPARARAGAGGARLGVDHHRLARARARAPDRRARARPPRGGGEQRDRGAPLGTR